MKRLAILSGLLMITSCDAAQILTTEQYVKDAQSQLTAESLKLQEKIDARLPVSSRATAGKVGRRKQELMNFSHPVFIIGDDAVSRQWLQAHAAELEAANALGFVANITDSEALQTLQQVTKAPLLPTNVDDLMAIFEENHYPLAFIEGELWQ